MPLLINYQARITSNTGVPVNGNIKVEFQIVDAGGVQLGTWMETHNAVPVTNGIFNVIVGSVTDLPPALLVGPPLDSDGRPLRFLRVEVDDQHLMPNHRITSAPYSIIGGGP